MDYGKLTKKELIELLEEREIAYSSSKTKQQLEDLLIERDSQENNKFTISQTGDSNLSKIGAYLNIIGAVISILFLFWTIIFLIGGLVTIITNANFLKGKTSKTKPGIWGLFFGGLIGSIFVLIGPNYI